MCGGGGSQYSTKPLDQLIFGLASINLLDRSGSSLELSGFMDLCRLSVTDYDSCKHVFKKIHYFSVAYLKYYSIAFLTTTVKYKMSYLEKEDLVNTAKASIRL